MKDGRPFTFAPALEKTGRTPNLTVAPNELAAQIHPRMPVILPEKHHASWLGETENGNLSYGCSKCFGRKAPSGFRSTRRRSLQAISRVQLSVAPRLSQRHEDLPEEKQKIVAQFPALPEKELTFVRFLYGGLLFSAFCQMSGSSHVLQPKRWQLCPVHLCDKRIQCSSLGHMTYQQLRFMRRRAHGLSGITIPGVGRKAVVGPQ